MTHHDQPTPGHYWAVMRAYDMSTIVSKEGIELRWPQDGPCAFIPLFNTREKALAWAKSDSEVVSLTRQPE